MPGNVYGHLLDALSRNKWAILATVFDDVKTGDKAPIFRQFLITGHLNRSHINYPPCMGLEQVARLAFKTGQLQFARRDGSIILCEPYYPEPRLVIFGGGHIAQPLTEFGARVGFQITVVDDRQVFANKLRFSEAKEVICDGFDRVFERLDLDESTFVVIVTRGHRYDIVCLRRALSYKLAYLGVIGSKRRIADTKEQLLSEGYSKEQLDRLHAPIGLSIGAVTPEEIAISIIAEVISVKRLSTKGRRLEFDRAVIEELTLGTSPVALATVVSAKGSTPRAAGAKMLIWPDGRTLGSVGGGCGEAEVVRAAREMVGCGNYKMLEIDLTAGIAEDEGMACGGVMDVLIQDLSGLEQSTKPCIYQAYIPQTVS